MFRPLLLAGAIAPCLAIAFPASAQQRAEDAAASDKRSGGDIIVTGTKTADAFAGKAGIALEKLPQSVQIISAEDIVEQGYRSIGDVLRAVPSANVGNSRVARYQSFSLKVRGFLADQIRNGQRQRYFEDIDPSAFSNVERIEVLKGPSSVLFGQSAVGGLISIVTKRPADTFSAEAALTGGSYDQRLASIDINVPITGTLSIRATGEIERSGTFVDFQDIDRNNAALNLAWRPAPGIAAFVVAEYVERRTLGNPGLPVVGTVVDNGTGRRADRSTFLGEPALRQLTADAPLVQTWIDLSLGNGWALTPRYQYQEFNTGFSQVRVREIARDNRTVARNGRYGREEDVYQIAQLDLTGRIRTGPVSHQLLVGGEYDRERGTFFQENFKNVPSIDALDPVYAYGATAVPTAVFAFRSRGDLDGWSLYAQDQVALLPGLDVLAAVRHGWYDYTSVFNGAVDRSRIEATTWQLGATYRASDRLSFYGGYNTGFDLENVLGARSASGRPFDPERSNQLEAGVRFGTPRLRASVSVFQVQRTNALTTDPNNADFQVSQGKVRARGFELEGRAQPIDALTIEGGYAYLDGRVTRSFDGDQGARLGDTPEHTANLRGRLAIGSSIELRAAGYYVGPRKLVNGSATTLGDYATLDLGAGWTHGPLKFDLIVTNLTDTRFFTATGTTFAVFPGDPRTLSLRVGYRLGSTGR